MLLLLPVCAFADPRSDEQVAIAAERNGDRDSAAKLYASAYEEYREQGQHADAARVSQSLMLLQIGQGQLNEAIRAGANAREELLLDGRPDAAAQLANQLGSLLKARREFELAEESYRSALEIHAESGNGPGRAGTLMSLGLLAEMMEDPAASAGWFEQAGDAFMELGDERGLMHSYANAGQAWLSAGEPAKAEQAFRQALFLCSKLDEPHSCLMQQLGLSRALRELGRNAEALESSELCLAILREHPDSLLNAHAMLERGRILRAMEDYGGSLDAMLDAWDAYALEGLPEEQAAMGLELVEAAQRAGRSDLASRYRQLLSELNGAF